MANHSAGSKTTWILERSRYDSEEFPRSATTGKKCSKVSHFIELGSGVFAVFFRILISFLVAAGATEKKYFVTSGTCFSDVGGKTKLKCQLMFG